jgi:hypothetical protein
MSNCQANRSGGVHPRKSVFVKNFDAVFGCDEHDAPFRDHAIAECPNPTG